MALLDHDTGLRNRKQLTQVGLQIVARLTVNGHRSNLKAAPVPERIRAWIDTTQARLGNDLDLKDESLSLPAKHQIKASQ